MAPWLTITAGPVDRSAVAVILASVRSDPRARRCRRVGPEGIAPPCPVMRARTSSPSDWSLSASPSRTSALHLRRALSPACRQGLAGVCAAGDPRPRRGGGRPTCQARTTSPAERSSRPWRSAASSLTRAISPAEAAPSLADFEAHFLVRPDGTTPALRRLMRHLSPLHLRSSSSATTAASHKLSWSARTWASASARLCWPRPDPGSSGLRRTTKT